MFFLAGLPLLIQSDVLFCNISAETHKRKSSCHFAWRNGSIADGCLFMFVHPTNTAVIGLERLSYQLKIISIIIRISLLYYQGRKWNMPDFWNRHNHIIALKFIGSFEAAAFSFTNLFFPPSHFSLFSSGRTFPLLPSPFCSNSFKKKKNSSQKNYLHFECNAKH